MRVTEKPLTEGVLQDITLRNKVRTVTVRGEEAKMRVLREWKKAESRTSEE